jgi:glucoamylase
MPLVWAHAEFIKLMVSRHLGHPVDRPRAVWRRYRARRPTPNYAFWWPHAPIRAILSGLRLAVVLPRPAIVHWGSDRWQNPLDEPTQDTGLGFHIASLEVARMPARASINFIWQWQDTTTWHGRDYELTVLPADASAEREKQDPSPARPAALSTPSGL